MLLKTYLTHYVPATGGKNGERKRCDDCSALLYNGQEISGYLKATVAPYGVSIVRSGSSLETLKSDKAFKTLQNKPESTYLEHSAIRITFILGATRSVYSQEALVRELAFEKRLAFDFHHCFVGSFGLDCLDYSIIHYLWAFYVIKAS